MYLLVRRLGVQLPFTRSKSSPNVHASHWFVYIFIVCRWWVMSKVMHKFDASYVSCWAGIYYYTIRIPCDDRQNHASLRLSFSPCTKSNAGALRTAQWINCPYVQTDSPQILDRSTHGRRSKEFRPNKQMGRGASRGILKSMSIKSVKLALCLLAPKLVHGIKSLRFFLLKFVPQF